MSTDSSRAPSTGCYVPMLNESNYQKWQWAIKAYLSPHDHVRVIKRVRTATALVDPQPPTDASELERWHQSERMALGIIAGTIIDIHLELLHKYEDRSVWDLWCAIESQHVQQDASLRHVAWMGLLGLRKEPDESYTKYLRRLSDARDKVDRVTPSGLSPERRMDELMLFITLSGLQSDDSLRRSLLTHRNLTLDDICAVFLRTDQDSSISAGIESANAATTLRCFICRLLGHLAKDCPHAEALERFIAQRVASSSSTTGGKDKRKFKNRPAQNGTPTSSSNAANASSTTASTTFDSAGVASSFLSHDSRATNGWLCELGATSTMSSSRSFFVGLKPDRRAIRLADGNVIYSKGLGSIRFLSDCGYYVTIHDVLYVPSLSTNLFASNKFARQHRDVYSEVVDFPLRRWVNRLTGATEFTATIGSNDLAYINWKPAPISDHANVTIAELHARLNHLPLSAIRHLLRERPVVGLPDHVSSLPSGDACEDCINGKLTRAPHTKPAARADRPLYRVFSDVHGPLPVRSRRGHLYWVTFIDDFSRFPAVYFITRKSDVFDAFRKYKAWAENLTGHRIGILRDDKGGEYSGADLDSFLAEAGIRRGHSIRDTPQQLGVAERMNRSLSEGITVLLSQSGLTRTWWEDAAMHWLYGKIRIPSSATGPSTPFELFYNRKPDVSALRPFGCLAYVHLQKDQRPALASHAAQCIFVGYPRDYKGWLFWNPVTRREIVSDSAIFRESVFPYRKTGLSGLDLSVDPSPPTGNFFATPDLFAPPIISSAPLAPVVVDPVVTTPVGPVPRAGAPAEPAPSGEPSHLVVRVPHVAPPPVLLAPPQPVASPPQLVASPPPPGPDLPERPRTPPGVRMLTTDFEHHPSHGPPLPAKRASRGRQPGTLAEANLGVTPVDFAVPIVDAIECAFSTSASLEPKSLAEAIVRPDGEAWIAAALAEIEAHLENGTWELAQLPPGRRAIGSRWIFKIKRKPDGSVDKYKGRIVAQGFSQVQGVHYNEVFASTARMAAMRTVIAIAAAEDLELDSVDVSTAFLNGDIDAEVYMKIPDGLCVEGDPAPGEDPKRWVVRLLKGLYGIKQGPRIWALKLHSVLTGIGFQRTDCDHSVYVYQRDGVRIMLPIHVDDLLLASNSKAALRAVKAELGSHFKLHDLGPTSSILGMKLVRDRAARSISLSQPGYIESILEHFQMADCNPVQTPMEENIKLSSSMSPSSVEERLAMKNIPYRELVGKLLYLAIATRPDIAYAVGVLCRFVENPGPAHWDAGKRVLRYLKGTTNMCLVYSGSSSPVDRFATYSDADLGGNPDNSRSTGGFAICIGGGAVQWGSRLQPHVSLSSTESEYTTVSKVGCEVMWMRYLLGEFGYDISRPSKVFMDNKSAIQVVKHPEHQSTMKHVHRAFHWIRSCVENGDLEVSHVPGDENPADIFTKPLGRLKFAKFRAMLGMRA